VDSAAILIVVPPILTDLFPTILTSAEEIFTLFCALIEISPSSALTSNAAPVIEANVPSYVRTKPEVPAFPPSEL